MDKLAVIVVNWNGLTDTLECMESLLNQSLTGFQIFLIDNSSENNESAELTKLFGENPKVILIQNTTNLGFGNAHNLLFEKLIQQGYQRVALLNNDAVADPDWLEQALKTMEETNADIVACKMINYYNHSLLDSAGLYMLNTGEILPCGHNHPSGRFSTSGEVISFCAGACLLKLEVIRQIGGFDNYFDTGYEDAELGLRAFLAGEKIIYSPFSVAFHKMGQSQAKVAGYRRTRKIMQDVRYTWYKLMPVSILLFSFPVRFIRDVCILLLHLVTFRFRLIIFYFDALFRFFSSDLKKTIQARKQVLRKNGFLKVLSMQKCFLATDYRRFFVYFVKGKPGKFET